MLGARPAYACGGGEGATAHIFAGAQTTVGQLTPEAERKGKLLQERYRLSFDAFATYAHSLSATTFSPVPSYVAFVITYLFFPEVAYAPTIDDMQTSTEN